MDGKSPEVRGLDLALDIMADKEWKLRERLTAHEAEMANLRDEILRLRGLADRMAEPFPEMPDLPSQRTEGEFIERMRARRKVGEDRAKAAAEYREWRAKTR